MNRFSLFEYLKKNSEVDEASLDLLKYEIDKRVYMYGKHFKYSSDDQRIIKYYIRYLPKCFLYLYNSLKWPLAGTKPRVVSGAYFGLNKFLSNLGYDVFDPFWVTKWNLRYLVTLDLFLRCESLKKTLRYGDFRDILSPRFIDQITKFEELLRQFLKESNVKGLIVPQDMSFFEKMCIEICRDLNIPSFVFLHGLPTRYNSIDDNRADYLVVWGKKIKEQYVKAGVAAEKIFVSGHPLFQNLRPQDLKLGLGSILVLTYSISGCPENSDRVTLQDRGNTIFYLMSIESVLKSTGVSKVRVRVHPSENPRWYRESVDREFFEFDVEDLTTSIKKSTLVIGPPSTVFLESLCLGVNYLVYEPLVNGCNLKNFSLFPPFDGSDERVVVAFDEREMRQLLLERRTVDLKVLEDYIDFPFDLSFMKRIV